MGVNIVWFKRDLRLLDHEPLTFAIARGQPLLMIYIVEPELIRNPHYRRRHWHFIAQSLADLNRKLQPHGTKIWTLEGEPTAVLTALSRELDVDVDHALGLKERGARIRCVRREDDAAGRRARHEVLIHGDDVRLTPTLIRADVGRGVAFQHGRIRDVDDRVQVGRALTARDLLAATDKHKESALQDQGEELHPFTIHIWWNSGQDAPIPWKQRLRP